MLLAKTSHVIEPSLRGREIALSREVLQSYMAKVSFIGRAEKLRPFMQSISKKSNL